LPEGRGASSKDVAEKLGIKPLIADLIPTNGIVLISVFRFSIPELNIVLKVEKIPVRYPEETPQTN
jgi:hypothetical protein